LIDAQTREEVLYELLFKPELKLVSTLCELSRGKPIEDEVMRNILLLFEHRGDTLKLFEMYINKEVERTSKS
jgi:hypothetical protein